MYIADYNFLKETDIKTIPELQSYIMETEKEIAEKETQRQTLRNKIRHKNSSEIKAENHAQRSETIKQIEPLRENLRRAKDALEKSPHIYELLKTEMPLYLQYGNSCQWKHLWLR